MCGSPRRRHEPAGPAGADVLRGGNGPATVFAKAVDPDHADLVALTSGLYHEPTVVRSGVVLPLDHPTVYTAIIDEDRRLPHDHGGRRRAWGRSSDSTSR